MDRETIVKQAHQMETKEDLLCLLNRMKHDEMEEAGMVDKYYPFTMQNIDYYCNPNHAHHRYRKFRIKKKSGGFRQITAPKNPCFKLILHYLNEMFKALYTPSVHAMGFTEGRSVVSNASVHTGQNYVFNTDLENFFPSIHQARVWKRIQLKPLSFSQSVANVIAGLCAMRDYEDDGTVRYVLPQGAPTSPIITNMICDKLDCRLAGLARRFGLNYSRYADDITFSSMHNVYHPDGEFRRELRRIIENQGFTINEAKTRLQKRGARQEVTGIVVSDKLNVLQKYVRDIRNVLYIWKKYGYGTAYNKFFPKYKSEKGHVKKGNPDMANVLDGKLMYLKMVKGDDDSVYVRLKRQFDELAGSLSNLEKTAESGVTYVETISIKEFERKNGTEVVITMPKPKDSGTESKATGKFTVNDMKKRQPRRYAYFMLGGRKQLASVNKSIKPEDEGKNELLAISHCRDAKGKMFWLVHYANKVIRQHSATVDLDSLNNDLDNLLKL